MKIKFIFGRILVPIVLIVFFVVSSYIIYVKPLVVQPDSWGEYVIYEFFSCGIGAVFVMIVKYFVNGQKEQLNNYLKLPHLIWLVVFVILLILATVSDIMVVDKLFDALIINLPTIILIELFLSFFERCNLCNSRDKKNK